VAVICNISISLDGFVAGPNQSLENPIGEGGMRLHEWMFQTESWRKLHGEKGGERTPDSEVLDEFSRNVGAYIMGRKMFGGGDGEWDLSWKGWWGDEPPYHTPVFVLTHYPRAPLLMKGGTEFRFVIDGIQAALEQARAAAGGRDVRLGGGVSTIRQYLSAGLIDELHLAVRPVLLGKGEHLLRDIDARALGYECAKYIAGERAAHVLLRKRR
jgi:dihydrofolate reductase